MKTFAKTVALVLFSLPLVASAAGKTASSSMQVSFVVKESCSVESTASAKAPAVACQLNTPYQLSRNADKAVPAAASTTANGVAVRPDAAAQDWTIYF